MLPRAAARDFPKNPVDEDHDEWDEEEDDDGSHQEDEAGFDLGDSDVAAETELDGDLVGRLARYPHHPEQDDRVRLTQLAEQPVVCHDQDDSHVICRFRLMIVPDHLPPAILLLVLFQTRSVRGCFVARGNVFPFETRTVVTAARHYFQTRTVVFTAAGISFQTAKAVVFTTVFCFETISLFETKAVLPTTGHPCQTRTVILTAVIWFETRAVITAGQSGHSFQTRTFVSTAVFGFETRAVAITVRHSLGAQTITSIDVFSYEIRPTDIIDDVRNAIGIRTRVSTVVNEVRSFRTTRPSIFTVVSRPQITCRRHFKSMSGYFTAAAAHSF